MRGVWPSIGWTQLLDLQQVTWSEIHIIPKWLRMHKAKYKMESFYNLLEGAFQSVCCVSTMEMVWPPTRFAVFLPVPSWQITGPGSLRARREALDFIVVTRRDMLWPGMANSIHLVVEHMGKQVGTSHQTIHTQSRRPFFLSPPLLLLKTQALPAWQTSAAESKITQTHQTCKLGKRTIIHRTWRYLTDTWW